jgi:predicted SprT family Zn-dependent metalloprotease
LSQEKQIGQRIQDKSAEYFLLWDATALANSIDTQFSNRLHRALGRARVDTRRVRLNPILLNVNIELLDEVLCHELAHIVVYTRFGRKARPHGSEWADLMRQAGYKPRLRINLEEEKLSILINTYVHLCPVCQIIRYARRPMYRWRCVSCVKAGLDGKLHIQCISKT